MAQWCVLLWMVLVAMRMRHVCGAQACGQEAESSSSCLAMVGYTASANVGLSDIASLFSVNYTAVLGPNDVEPSLWESGADVVVPARARPYLVPQTCGCVNGTRVVTGLNYTVVAGDSLSGIAAGFSNLITYTDIAQASGIANPNLIQIGQQVVIPIPCACTGSDRTIALTYKIQPGDTLSTIAGSYNTSTLQLEQLNSLSAANASDLKASQLLFVPLAACKANFSSGVADGNLTVVAGTYELTANNCVQCFCDNSLYVLHPSSTLSF